jgi:hypothetical protein
MQKYDERIVACGSFDGPLGQKGRGVAAGEPKLGQPLESDE